MSDQNQDDVHQDGNGAGTVPTAVAGGDGTDEGTRLAALQAERDETKDRMLRIAADFENWKKRARKEQEEAEAKVRETVLRDMLDVMDNLERAVGAYGTGDDAGAPKVDGAAILKGVSLVVRLFQSKLERYGVKPIDAKGQPFNPHIHEAISRTESTEVPPGNVITELQRGYRIGERLLRPSMVSVAAAPTGQGGGGVKGA